MDQATLLRVANFDNATAAQLAVGTASLVDSVSAAGALDLAKYQTELTVSGTKAYTLAAPTFAGQMKRIVCVSAASTPLGTVTISSPDTTTGFACSSTFTFTAAGQAIDLVATAGLLWRCVRVQRSGVLTVVVGTDVLTGLNLVANYALSVTGTVSSTGTKSFPNGSAVGEVALISNSVAASTPIGNINWTGLSLIGAASTDIQAIGATTDTVLCMWTGAAWQAISAAGVTFA